MFPGIGPQELMIVGILAVVLYGKKLPEVAKKLGGTYREFRKGLSEMQAQIRLDDTPSHRSAPSVKRYDDDFDDYDLPTTSKFEPPTGGPTSAEPSFESHSNEARPG